MISESEILARVEQCNVRIPTTQKISLLTEAEQFISKVGYPCVLKLMPGHNLHKTDGEGVITGIRSFGQLEKAFMSLWQRFPKEPAFLLQKQIECGVELLMGLQYDRLFGFVLSLGIGGLLTEIYDDTVFRVCPITFQDADDMIEQLRGRQVLAAFRGLPRVRTDNIKQILVDLSHLPDTLQTLNALELNPVICNQEGEFAVDVTFSEHIQDTVQSETSLAAVDMFFQPQSIAVVGASRNPHKGGSEIIANLVRFGFSGAIIPINPEVKKVHSLRCYASLSEVPEHIDLAVLAIPRMRVLTVVREGTRRGIRNYIVCSSGFSDGSGAGVRLENDLIEFARGHKLNIMGPNSFGTINTAHNLVTALTHLEKIQPGNISILSQSNLFASSYARFFSSGQHSRIAKIACLGNKAILQEADFLHYFLTDEQTKVVGVVLQSIQSGKSFMMTMNKLTRKKPVVVLKSGNVHNDTTAHPFHSGSMAVNDKVFTGISKQCGFVRVSDTEEMLDVLNVFDLQPLARGKRVAVISVSSLGCILAADYCGQFKLNLVTLRKRTRGRILEVVPDWAIVRNPVDMWPVIEKHGVEKAFSSVLAAFAEDQEIDIIVLIFVLIDQTRFHYDEVLSPILSTCPDKIVIAARLGGDHKDIRDWEQCFRSLGVPTFSDPFPAFSALSKVVEYSRMRSNRSPDNQSRAH